LIGRPKKESAIKRGEKHPSEGGFKPKKSAGTMKRKSEPSFVTVLHRNLRDVMSNFSKGLKKGVGILKPWVSPGSLVSSPENQNFRRRSIGGSGEFLVVFD